MTRRAMLLWGFEFASNGFSATVMRNRIVFQWNPVGGHHEALSGRRQLGSA